MPDSVLVVGSGAREHALVWALARSPSVGVIWSMPGSPGIARLATTVGIPVTDVEAIADWAAAQAIDLVVVGPEAPLARGLVDLLEDRGVPVFGPTRAAAELEWSKAFAKAFMHRHGIPTAPFAEFTELDAALAYVRSRDFPLVVKADGLAAGKGVVVCQALPEAQTAIYEMLAGGAFGAAGERIVIEEFLVGEELSVIALVDGERIAVLPTARDYKRLSDGDMGPNTGGMGSFAPVDDYDPALLDLIVTTVLRPVVAGMRAEGRPYRGALYAGLMLTHDGPRVLEFNCRFGDPETQAILPLLDGDLAELLYSCAVGRLDPKAVRTKSGTAVCVVLAAAGYPEYPRGGDVINGVDVAAAGGALVFQAGTDLRDGELVTAGGRVISVVGVGADLAEATGRAYTAAEIIQFAGKQMRRDIAAPALVSLA